MKKVIFILTLLVSVGTLYAQQTKTKTAGQNNKKYANLDDRVNQVTGKLKTLLSLNDNQTAQVRAITLNRVKQVNDAKSSFGDDKKGFNQARKTIFIGWESELKEILTPDQYAAYLVKKDEAKKAKEAKSDDDDIEDMITN